MGIRKKFIVLYALLGLVIGLIGLVNYWAVRTNTRMLQRIIDENTPTIEVLLNIKTTVGEIKQQTLSFELREENPTLAEGTSAGDEQASLLAKVERLNEWIKNYRDHIPVDQPDKVTRLEKIIQTKQIVVDRALALYRAKQLGQGAQDWQKIKLSLENGYTNLTELINRALEQEARDLQNAKKESQLLSNFVMIRITGVSVFGLILAALFVFLMTRALVRPIYQLREGTQRVAGGDLNTPVRVKSTDELGQLADSFNKMTEELRISQQQLTASNQQLKSNEQQLKTINQQLTANEQQLKASNQQLVANEQQLKASNQQLVANEQQLKASNQQLKAANEAANNVREKLQEKVFELERFQKVTVNRELRMVELKKRINVLLEELGRPGEFTGAETGGDG